MSSITRVCVVALLLTAALQGPARAEISAEVLKQQIQQRSDKIKEFRALLNDPDQTVRLAALDVMLQSDDPVMRELAYGAGFSSADDAMRAVALKNKLADLKTIVIKIDDMSNPSETQQKAIKDWGGNYSFEIKTYDRNSGQFESSGSYRNGKGQVSGIGLEFSQPYCDGSFTLADGAVLEGKLGCTGSWSGSYPGLIRLQ